jgi:hypothetical protein
VIPGTGEYAAEDDDRLVDFGVPGYEWQVFSYDNISWPTRGPNVDWTIGSTMRGRVAAGHKSACK